VGDDSLAIARESEIASGISSLLGEGGGRRRSISSQLARTSYDDRDIRIDRTFHASLSRDGERERDSIRFDEAIAVAPKVGASFVNVIKKGRCSRVVHEQNRPTCRQAETR